jgi:hypothetical protein
VFGREPENPEPAAEGEKSGGGGILDMICPAQELIDCYVTLFAKLSVHPLRSNLSTRISRRKIFEDC